MSRTLEVLPGTEYIPAFDEILQTANRFLTEYLHRHNIDVHYLIQVSAGKGSEVRTLDLHQPAMWEHNEYAWFTVSGQTGGCDAYYAEFDDLDIECWNDIIADNPKASGYQKEIRKGIELSYSWNFWRSAGQPAIINLVYGMLAAAYAYFTDGLIYSNDSAWDYDLFPARYDEFLEHYFDPRCKSREYGDWAKRCLEVMERPGEKC